MATVNHSALTGANLHEPKGVGSAAANQVYLSDGAGGGTWTTLSTLIDSNQGTGWEVWDDATNTGGTELDILTGGTVITIDGAGSSTNTTYKPTGASSLWSTSNNKIMPVAIGDTYDLRLDYLVSTHTGTVNYVTWELDIGGSLGVIVSQTRIYDKGSPEEAALTFPIFTLATFVTNGGTIKATLNGTGTLKIQNIRILIIRTTKAQ